MVTGSWRIFCVVYIQSKLTPSNQRRQPPRHCEGVSCDNQYFWLGRRRLVVGQRGGRRGGGRSWYIYDIISGIIEKGRERRRRRRRGWRKGARKEGVREK